MKTTYIKLEIFILVLLSIIMNIDILYLLYHFYSDLVYNLVEIGLQEIIIKHQIRLYNTLLSIIFTTSCALLVYFIYNTTNKSNSNKKKATFFSLLVAVVLIQISVYVHFNYFGDLDYNQSEAITIFRLFIWYSARATYMTLIAIYISDLRLKKEDEQKKAMLVNELELENSFTKYNMLREQINPHFIFNTINTLNALIQNNDKKSIEYINKISKLLNYAISEKDRAKIHDEIIISQSYAYLIEMRYKENVQFIFNIHECAENNEIPIFSLQTLLENAIKHNSITKDKKLIISIECNNNYIEVKNNINKKNEIYESTGIGLHNLSQRYKLLSNKELIINIIDKQFIVKLPYL